MALLLTTMAGCNRDPRALGDSCTRSSECDDGLVCVDQACSDDLKQLGDRGGMVPMLMMPEETPVEAGADAAPMQNEAMDASTATMPDASTATAPDASTATAQDASLPDAGP